MSSLIPDYADQLSEESSRVELELVYDSSLPVRDERVETEEIPFPSLISEENH